MKFRNPFRKHLEIKSNPFMSGRIALAKFLGEVAGGVVTGEVTESEAQEIVKLTTKFFQALALKDFTFGSFEVGSEDHKRLSYST